MGKKALIIGMFALALVSGGVLGTAVVTRADTSTIGMGMALKQNRADFMKNIVTAISQKFSLNEAEVQSVVNLEIEKREGEMEKKMEEVVKQKLSEAVTNGKITQTQADLILAKQKEVKSKLEALKDKSEEERVAGIKTIMDELKSWSEQNNIPSDLRIFGFGKGPRHHGGMMKIKLNSQ